MIINRHIIKDGERLIQTYSDKSVWIENVKAERRIETFCEATYPESLSGLYRFEETELAIPDDITVPTGYELDTSYGG